MTVGWILESARDRYCEFLAPYSGGLGTRSRGEPATPPPVRHRCNLCGRAIHDWAGEVDAVYLAHLRQAHPAVDVFLRVNDRVVRRIVDTPRVSAATLHATSEYPLDVALDAGGQTRRDVVERSLDLTQWLAPMRETDVRITVSLPEGRERAYTIRLRDVPVLDEGRWSAKIDALQALVRDRVDRVALERSVSRLQREADSFEAVDRQYVDGFVDFVWGIDLERAGQVNEASDHLTRAMRTLATFSTPAAIAACCVLGIRMNAFTALDRWVGGPPFDVAVKFFCGGDELNTSDVEDAGGGTINLASDDFTFKLIQVLRAIVAGPGARPLTQSLLDELWRVPTRSAPDNEAKFYRAQATAALSWGERGLARDALSKLESDRTFGPLAREQGRDLPETEQ